MIISTQYKIKVGRGFSYPIGAEALTLALGNVPQAAVMSIRFTMPYRQRFEPNKPYAVVTLNFENYRPHRSTPRNWSHGGPKWEIWVYAVPKGVRHTISLLLKDALARQARPWLLARQRTYEGSIRFVISYRPSSKELVCDAQDRAAPDLLKQRPVAPVLPSTGDYRGRTTS